MEEIQELYKRHFGHSPAVCQLLQESGSNRRNYRLTGDGTPSVIGTVGTVIEENEAFRAISAHGVSKGLNLPEVLAVSEDGFCYLQEDLGESTLYDLLAEQRRLGRYDDNSRRMLADVMRALPRLQFELGAGFDFSVCYPQESLDRRGILFDLNYFKYCFLKLTGVQFSETSLQDDFENLADGILAHCQDCETFMYRDFQSRNVMVRDGRPWFIDFQGGRRGPVYYDIASFVWQAQARYPDDLRQQLVEAYLDAARPYRVFEKEDFMKTLKMFVLFRSIQVLGAYGFRGYIEKKAHFLSSIPYALLNVRGLLDEQLQESYPTLSEVLSKLSEGASLPQTDSNDGLLTVEVTSFSYRAGIPDDLSGNGGGFVFDCRALENPGRYAPYKPYCGLDACVQEFLEKDGGILLFLEKVKALTDPQIETYIKRGFSHLMISFGCTGGQHRSVYGAQKLAEHIASKYENVHVTVNHTNINVCKRLK
ncbi:MAG: phosphotransferase [Bacteroidales bacterium]|nr:phosphotransferase [Bacteroidales bacterium]